MSSTAACDSQSSSSCSVNVEYLDIPPASLLDVLALFQFLRENGKKLHREDDAILSTVSKGVEILISKGIDYIPRSRFSHFQYRLRSCWHRGRAGPQLINGSSFQAIRARLRNDFRRPTTTVSLATNDERKLMRLLSLGLVFRNYNRSVRILDAFFSPENKKRASTIAWLRSDLESLGVDPWALRQVNTQREQVFLYIPVAKRIELETLDAERKYGLLPEIQAHPEGGRVKSKPLITWASRIYVVTIVVLSILAGVFNIANRDNAFERAMDAVQIATLFLVTVFGLVKLTSEDPNVIRNSFLGYRVVRMPSDVADVWQLRDEKEVKKAVAFSDVRQAWLDPEGSCYAVSGCGRGIMLSRGIEPLSLYEIGGDFDGNRYYRGNDEKGLRVEVGETGVAHIIESDKKFIFPAIAAPRPMSLVAGKYMPAGGNRTAAALLTPGSITS